MTASPRRQSTDNKALSHGVAWLVLAALLLRALIPPGYMVSPQGGAAPFTLCTSIHDGVSRLLTAQADTHPPHDHHGPASTPDDSHDAVGPCAFGGLAALILPAPLPVLPPHRRAQPSRWRRVRNGHRPRQRAPGDPGARAPPMAA